MSLGANNVADAPAISIATSGATYNSTPTPNASLNKEVDEPQPTSFGAERTAWWKYTPMVTGTATVSTQNTAAGGGDTEIAVYTATDVNNFATFTKVASDADSGVGNTSLITGMSVTAGSTYYIQVGAYVGLMDYELAVTGPTTVLSDEFDGTVAAVSASSGEFTVRHVLSGTAPAVSGTSGGVNITGEALEGTVAAVSGVEGELSDVFVPFDPPRHGFGIRFGCTNVNDTPLPVDADAVVTYKRVAASVSEG